jgi:hypothetical protein
MSTFKFDCDTESSTSVANVLSNEELNNSKLSNLLSTEELNIAIEDKLPLNALANEELIEDDIKICDDEIEELTTATSMSVAISLYPIVPVINICDEPDTTPSGKVAATLFVMILIIEAESDVSKDCDTALLTASEKLPPDWLIALPALTAACNSVLPSICFNLIKFAISYKYLSLL